MRPRALAPYSVTLLSPWRVAATGPRPILGTFCAATGPRLDCRRSMGMHCHNSAQWRPTASTKCPTTNTRLQTRGAHRPRSDARHLLSKRLSWVCVSVCSSANTQLCWKNKRSDAIHCVTRVRVSRCDDQCSRCPPHFKAIAGTDLDLSCQ